MEDQTMKKNFKLHALLLALGLGATRISLTIEEHLPEHASAHEPEPHETPEEIQKRHEKEQRELKEQQKSEKRTTEKQIDTATANKEGRKAQDAQKTAIDNLKEKGITIGDPKAPDAAEKAKDQLAEKHAQEKSDLDVKHADEKAAATKATDELGDAFEGLSEDTPEPSKSEEPTTEEPTAKGSDTPTAQDQKDQKTRMDKVNDFIKGLNDAMHEIDRGMTKDIKDAINDSSKIVDDLMEKAKTAATTTKAGFEGLIDTIMDLLKGMMSRLSAEKDSLKESAKAKIDELSAQFDEMKSKLEVAKSEMELRVRLATSEVTEAVKRQVKSARDTVSAAADKVIDKMETLKDLSEKAGGLMDQAKQQIKELKNSAAQSFTEKMGSLRDTFEDLKKSLGAKSDAATKRIKDSIDQLQKSISDGIDSVRKALNKETASKPTESEEESAKKEPAKEKPSKKESAQAKPETPKTPKEKALDALGLTGDPTWQEVRDAFKKNSLESHPDKWNANHPNATPEEQKANLEKSKKINDSYTELKGIYGK